MAQAELTLHPLRDDDFDYSSEEEAPKKLKSVVVKAKAGSASCPVKECFGKSFASTKAVWVHWRATHLRYNLYHGCPVEGCQIVRKRRTDINKHFRLVHRQFGVTAEESLQVLDLVPRVAELRANRHFVCPGDVKPPFPVSHPSRPVNCVSFRDKKKASLALARVAKKHLQGVAHVGRQPGSYPQPASPKVPEVVPDEPLSPTPKESPSPRSALENAKRSLAAQECRERAARRAQDVLRKKIARLEAAPKSLVEGYKQRIKTLEKRVAVLMTPKPALNNVAHLEGLALSRPLFVVPDVSGLNKVFMLTREDLRALRLQERSPCDGTEAL